MELQLKAPKIWLACKPVDFRKSIDGLTAMLTSEFHKTLSPDIIIFYNRAKNKVKLLARHQSGCILIYKRLDNRKFSFMETEQGLYELSSSQLSWLLAGLDWHLMTRCNELAFDDYF